MSDLRQILEASRQSQTIDSPKNATFKELMQLTEARGLKKSDFAIVYGQKVIDEVAAAHPQRVAAWIVTDGMDQPRTGSVKLPRVITLAAPLFRELDVVGTKSPLLLIHAPPLPTWSAAEPWPAGCTLFVGFQNPQNLGAVIRTAAAFGVARVVLLKECAHPFLPKSVRAAGTTLLNVPLLTGPSVTELAEAVGKHAPLITLDAHGDDLGAAPFPETFGLVPGVEGPGLPANLRLNSRKIPMAPGVESLNAAVATGIALYAWHTQHRRL